jgi:hypothetical protein
VRTAGPFDNGAAAREPTQCTFRNARYGSRERVGARRARRSRQQMPTIGRGNKDGIMFEEYLLWDGGS